MRSSDDAGGDPRRAARRLLPSPEEREKEAETEEGCGASLGMPGLLMDCGGRDEHWRSNNTS